MELSRDGVRRTSSMRWMSVFSSILLLLSVSSLVGEVRVAADSDYGQALALSFQFFEAQRSGYLPANNHVSWRASSGLHDGADEGIDLTGGYYDAGDNVKFGLPMAFTITTLSWSAIAYQGQLQQQGQLNTALDSIRWGTDYFIKAHPEPNVLWAEIGDGYSDHYCWERPEDMTTSRQAYKVDASNPGSEVAAETAAAMAAASIAFSSADPSYSSTLLTHAKELFTFADTYRGHYDDAIPIVKNYYPSGPSGYNDELLWAAVWLFEATNDNYYLQYLVDSAQILGGIGWGMTEFSWDVKYAGVQVLAAKILLEGRGGSDTSTLEAYKTQADYFMCGALGRNSGKNLARSPGGMLYTQAWNNMQFVTSGAFLVTYYADLLNTHGGQLHCSGSFVQPNELLALGQSQADYILGSNPRGESYMVGYGQNFPKFVHHRGASIPSIYEDSAQEQCRTGYSTWYISPNPNPNTLVGAIVGGPDQNDNYQDSRNNWEGGEACVYNNAPLVGLLARFAGGAYPSSTVSYTGTTSSTNDAAFVHVTQHLVSSWRGGDIYYFKYKGTLSNASHRILKGIVLAFGSQPQGSVYGLRQIGNTATYTFPEYQKSLLPGGSLQFVYMSRNSTPSALTIQQSKFV
ncbi:unnamed protein product [Calypogeia fissa]